MPASLCSVFGDAEELRRVGDSSRRLRRGLAICGIARDAAEQLRVVDAAERRGANGLERRSLGNGGQQLLVVQPGEGECRRRIRWRRGVGNRHEPLGVLPLQPFVSLSLRQQNEIFGSYQAVAGGTPDAHVGILAGQLAQHLQVFVVIRQCGDRLGADCGIGVLPTRLGLETIEERHGGALPTREGSSPPSAAKFTR
jgi:hypothetical protein